MNRAKLLWADGRVEIRDDIIPADRINVFAPDGRYYIFKGTDEIDEDGCDIYKEEPDSSAGEP